MMDLVLLFCRLLCTQITVKLIGERCYRNKERGKVKNLICRELWNKHEAFERR